MHNSFNVLMQTLNVDQVCQVRVNTRNFGFTQTWENNAKVMTSPNLSRSGLWMIWIGHSIPRVYCYYFCLEPTVTNDTAMRTTSVTVIVIFFESGILKVNWSQLCSKSLLYNYEGYWQQTPYSSIFYGHGSKCVHGWRLW